MAMAFMFIVAASFIIFGCFYLFDSRTSEKWTDIQLTTDN